MFDSACFHTYHKAASLPAPSSEHMSSLGATFRREREARGISLEEIAEETRIGIRLLRAIENEQFDRLPGGIFDKSFVRQYARYLGLDEELAVREYLQAVAAGREAVPSQRSGSPELPALSSSSDYARIIAALVGVGVLVAGIGYGLYRFQQYLTATPSPAGEGSSQPTLSLTPASPAFPPAESLSESSPAAIAPPPGGNPVAPLSGSSSGPSVPRVPRPAGQAAPLASREGLRLRIDSHGPVWLSITADGVKQWQGTMRPYQTREVRATESVRLTVGDAGAVEINLNGKPLPPLGRSGEVKSVTITAKGTPEPTP